MTTVHGRRRPPSSSEASVALPLDALQVETTDYAEVRRAAQRVVRLEQRRSLLQWRALLED